eukprot:COSAG06_NODE_57565_length_280_cov_0.569061_2_plen_21_part_01
MMMERDTVVERTDGGGEPTAL